MSRNTNSQSIISSTEFYNEVAERYDEYMSGNDARIRGIVAETFQRIVPPGIVLDFGGGTGLDLQWLKENYTTVFLEPSASMRAKAVSKFSQHPRISFIEENTDFNKWNASHLPFLQKPDCILMNYAVLNCIKDIVTLFEKFVLITKPGALIFATILNTELSYLFKNYTLFQFSKILLNRLTVYSHHNGLSHETYLHKLNYIRKISQDHFTITNIEVIAESPFKMIVLRRI